MHVKYRSPYYFDLFILQMCPPSVPPTPPPATVGSTAASNKGSHVTCLARVT